MFNIRKDTPREGVFSTSRGGSVKESAGTSAEEAADYINRALDSLRAEQYGDAEAFLGAALDALYPLL